MKRKLNKRSKMRIAEFLIVLVLSIIIIRFEHSRVGYFKFGGEYLVFFLYYLGKVFFTKSIESLKEVLNF